ncbi:MAG: SAM-dependent chlorinase/fluorinase [Candidatus Diapherotrites archaeon]|nr:SAM-dependent chlorinase/fluorinase [Candidatus Diapherotrites archaeon]
MSSDFEKQSQGVGNMEGVIYSINPKARVIHLMHGIPVFDVVSAARTMETVFHFPVGIHVCVVDPGVGTERKGIIVKVKRGDFFVGPDNGCLMTAPRMLGGIEQIVEVSNPKFLRLPVSPIFHGRDVFATAAAHLSLGVQMEEFGPELKVSKCVPAPFEEAKVINGKIEAIAIHKNHFGSIHLNVLAQEWNKLGLALGEEIELVVGRKKLRAPFVKTFGDVKPGKLLIMKDNRGSFIKIFPLKVGEKVVVKTA